MKRGTVKTIIKNGAAFIQSAELTKDVFCPQSLVVKFDLSVGSEVEFEYKSDDKGLQATSIKKSEPLLFRYALNIENLSPAEYDDFCNLVKAYVKEERFRKNITTSKIRNIFSAVKEKKDVKFVKRLRPKLAYLAGRDSGTAFFMNDLDELIQKITTDAEVKNFKTFFEAIICYAKEND